MKETRKYHHWKASEIKIIEDTYQTRSDAQLAEEFNTTIMAIRTLRRRLKIDRGIRNRVGSNNHKWTTDEIKYLVETFPKYPDTHYAEKFKISTAAVRVYRNKLKLCRLETPTKEVGLRRSKWKELRKMFTSMTNPGLRLDQLIEIERIIKDEQPRGIIYLDKRKAS